MPGLLKRSPANIVQYMLVDMGLGVADASGTAVWPVFAGDEPDNPDRVLTIYDTSGVLTGREMSESEMQGMYGLQFRARARDYPTCYEKLMAVAIAMDLVYYRRVNIQAQTYLVHDVKRLDNPLHLPLPNRTGKPPLNSDRKIFVFNALVSLKQVT